jgi:hypothetical protein
MPFGESAFIKRDLTKKQRTSCEKKTALATVDHHSVSAHTNASTRSGE